MFILPLHVKLFIYKENKNKPTEQTCYYADIIYAVHKQKVAVEFKIQGYPASKNPILRIDHIY